VLQPLPSSSTDARSARRGSAREALLDAWRAAADEAADAYAAWATAPFGDRRRAHAAYLAAADREAAGARELWYIDAAA
jgi:hypothetical protein